MNWNDGLVCWIEQGSIDMTKLDLWYAKINFRLNTDKRIAIYHKLASLLRNDFTLMNALNRLEMIESGGKKDSSEPFAIVMRQWQKNLELGMSFSDSTRGWVPFDETLLMTSGNISNLVVALENVNRIVSATQRIKRAMFAAIAYPLFLFLLTFLIIVMVGIYLIPPLVEVAGNNIVWRGVAASLVWCSDIAGTYWLPFLIVFIGLIGAIYVSLPNWTGKFRNIFDRFAPWSIYKIKTSVSWMLALSAMVSVGITIPDAMRMLADNSNKYLQDILEKTLHYIANGDNLGTALVNSGKNFPNSEIIGDLTIYADMNDFDKNLSNIANEYLENSVREMESVSNALNTFGIMLISFIIAWIVFGTFQMQEQITAALS